MLDWLLYVLTTATTDSKYEHVNWRKLCREHARKIMICPCYIVEKSECDECLIAVGDKR